MTLACSQTPCSGSTLRIPILIAMQLVALACFTVAITYAVADVTAAGEAYDCKKGCRRAFNPVCGKDGRTYSTACVATCQEVQVAGAGPCPGESLFHLTNEHVVDDDADDKEPDAAGTTAATVATSSASSILTRQHLDAFRHEGFRYTGQMRFTNDMPKKHHTQRQQTQEQQQQQERAGVSASRGMGPGLGLDPLLLLQQQQQCSGRAVRITRDGHVYMADMDENVDRVLDSLIQHQQSEAAKAETQQKQKQTTTTTMTSQTHALLHSLQQWRDYRNRGSGGGGVGGTGSKWARHKIITVTSGPADHVLQPGLDTTAVAGFAAQGPSTTSSTAFQNINNGDTTVEHQQQQQQQAEVQGDLSGTRVLGGSRSDRESKQQQQRREKQQQRRSSGASKEEAGGNGHGREFRGPVRRSLGIFDMDDRIDCPRTPTYPFTAVGQISVRDSSGNYVCSGALVGPDVVLTAGHCVFSRAAQAFYEKLDFAPSRYRTVDGQVVNPFGVVNWTHVTVYQTYATLSTPDPNIQDIAIINLEKRIGAQAGWMGIFEPCSPYAPTRYVSLTAGYPADQPPGSCKTTQCVVLQDPCTDGYLYHKCDTASGQSGSPMYMMAMTSGRKMGPYIRGVHNIEWVQELPNGSTTSYVNSAVSIIPDHYRSILAWIGLSFTTNGTAPMGPSMPPNDYMSSLLSG